MQKRSIDFAAWSDLLRRECTELFFKLGWGGVMKHMQKALEDSFNAGYAEGAEIGWLKVWDADAGWLEEVNNEEKESSEEKNV